MCRQGGYYEQAAYLATKHGENDLVVDILVEDSRKYGDALDFIWHLGAESVSAGPPRAACGAERTAADWRHVTRQP